MDLRTYYQKIRDAEAQLTGKDVVVISEVTAEGGKPGIATEVPRAVAAKLIAEGRARVASDEESLEFYDKAIAAREKFDHEEAARRVHVMVIPKERA